MLTGESAQGTAKDGDGNALRHQMELTEAVNKLHRNHHESHKKSTLRSALDGIPGVGEKRKAELKKHFGTIKAIREADVETLAAVIPRSAAEAVYRHFHESNEK